MKVIEHPKKLQTIIFELKRKGKSIGFVPTMGALHKGHLSLIRKARKDNDIVVVSIFVNPTQFAPNEDLQKYPRPWKQDKQQCKNLKVDYLFHPKVDKLYIEPHLTFVSVNKITNMLCGKSRPSHFQGVTTIVAKLLNIVQPTIAYFGQKDFQQSVVIKTMVKDLNFPVKIKVLPIVREKDGLAMSSRNKYLNETERIRALSLYHTLQYGKKLYDTGLTDFNILRQRLIKFLHRNINAKLDKVDYLEILDSQTLEKPSLKHHKVIIVLAVFIGHTRLIDNIFLG